MRRVSARSGNGRRRKLSKLPVLHVSRVRLTSGGVGGLRVEMTERVSSIRRYDTEIHRFTRYIRRSQVFRLKKKKRSTDSWSKEVAVKDSGPSPKSI